MESKIPLQDPTKLDPAKDLGWFPPVYLGYGDSPSESSHQKIGKL